MRKHPPLPNIKKFRPLSWYDSGLKSANDYISHLLAEVGRLGLKPHDIESHSRAPHTQTVLSDLQDWFDEGYGGAFVKIVNWQWLDLAQIQLRLNQDRNARPRIEVSAHITKMNNLSVRWHPGGWREANVDWSRLGEYTYNLVAQRKWDRQPDFHWFYGDEEPTFNSRPTNELMYIRGVGNLRPHPREEYGPYSRYNDDVVDSILICAVRSAYESLIAQLSQTFEVEPIDGFDFKVREEVDDGGTLSSKIATHRVTVWSLEKAADLRARRQKENLDKQEKQDRSEFENLEKKFGFTSERFVGAILQASSKKPSGPTPSGANLDRNTAKNLRMAGFSVNASDVRRIRDLIERYMPEVLPDTIKSVQPSPISDPSNVVQFPKERG